MDGLAATGSYSTIQLLFTATIDVFA